MIPALLLYFLLSRSAAFAAAVPEQPVMLAGHNLFSTTYLLSKNQLSVGNYILGTGLSSWATLAMSPWLLINYNLVNADLKIGGPIGSDQNRVSFEILGFKSFPGYWFGFGGQESIMLRGNASHRFNSIYCLHLGANYQYFWKDEWPFSLRPYPWNSDRYTLSAGGLHEISLGSSYTLFLETGVLGINHELPYLHAGISINRQFRWGYVQIGFSISRRDVPPRKSWDEFSTIHAYNEWRHQFVSPVGIDAWSSSADLPVNYRRIIPHPEIQVQYIF